MKKSNTETYTKFHMGKPLWVKNQHTEAISCIRVKLVYIQVTNLWSSLYWGNSSTKDYIHNRQFQFFLHNYQKWCLNPLYTMIEIIHTQSNSSTIFPDVYIFVLKYSLIQLLIVELPQIVNNMPRYLHRFNFLWVIPDEY